MASPSPISPYWEAEQEGSPWWRSLFTTEGFVPSLLYGATGYKQNEQAEDNVLGLIAGEIAGFAAFAIPGGAAFKGASALVKGLGLMKGARSSRKALTVAGSPEGRRTLQALGRMSSSNRAWHAAKSNLGLNSAAKLAGLELGFQATKLGTGGQLDDYETSGPELARNLILYPGLAAGGQVGITALSKGVGKLADKGALGKRMKAREERIKKNQEAVSSVELGELITQETIEQKQKAHDLMIKAGLDPQHAPDLVREGVVSRFFLDGRPAARQLLKAALHLSARKSGKFKPIEEAVARGELPPDTKAELAISDDQLNIIIDGLLPKPYDQVVRAFGDRIPDGTVPALDKWRAAKRAALEYQQAGEVTGREFLLQQFWGQDALFRDRVRRRVKEGGITKQQAEILETKQLLGLNTTASVMSRIRPISETLDKLAPNERVDFEDYFMAKSDKQRATQRYVSQRDKLLKSLIYHTKLPTNKKKFDAIRAAFRQIHGREMEKSRQKLLRAQFDEIAKEQKKAGENFDPEKLNTLIQKFWGSLTREEYQAVERTVKAAGDYAELRSGGIPGDAASVIKEKDVNEIVAAMEARHPEWVQMANEISKAINEGVIHRARQFNLIGDEAYAKMANNFYLLRRFIRIRELSGADREAAEQAWEELMAEIAGGEVRKRAGARIGRMKDGSTDVREYGIENLARRSMNMVEEASRRQQFGQSLAEGIASKQITDPDFARVRKLQEDGWSMEPVPLNMKEIRYKMPDMERPGEFVDGHILLDRKIYDAFEIMPAPMQQTHLAIASWLMGGNLLRAAATVTSPVFTLKNFFRDIGQQLLTSDARGSHVWEYLPALVDDLRATRAEAWKGHGELMDALIREGMQTPYRFRLGTDPALLHGEEAALKAQSRGRKSKAWGWLSKPAEFSEAWVRFSLARRVLLNEAKAQGKTMAEMAQNTAALQKAARAANDTIDFRVHAPFVKIVDVMFAPYSAAGLQGTRSLLRAARENPGRFTYMTSQMLTLSFFAYATSHLINREGYERIDEYTKENNYIFMLPGVTTDSKGNKISRYIKIPRPPIPGINELANAIPRAFLTGEIPSPDMAKRIQEGGNKLFDMGAPPSVQALVAYFGNYDLWKGEEVFKSFADVSPQFEVQAGTSAMARNIGELAGVSPVRLEAAFGKVFTGGNTWLRAFGFGWKGIADTLAENEVERDWFYNDLFELFPPGKAFSNTTPTASREWYEAIQGVKRDEADYRSQINGQFSKMADDVFRGHATWGDVRRFIRTQPVQERRRLTQRMKFLRKTKDVEHGRVLGFLAAGSSAKARGIGLFRVYDAIDDPQRKAKLLEDARVYPGFASNDVLRAFAQEEARATGRGLNR